MIIIVTEMHGPVMQMIRWNVLPYCTVSGSFMNAFTTGDAHSSKNAVPAAATIRLYANVVFTADIMRLKFFEE